MNLKDPTDFASAYDEHGRSVYSVAYRVLGDATLAQDVVQDVFLRLWRRPQAFDPARANLGTYLRVMARSRAVDLWREHQATGRAVDRLKAEEGVVALRTDAGPSVAAERSSTAEDVHRAVHTLPDNQREAIVLAYWGGLTAEQIARRMGVPLGTVKSRLRLALTKLRVETAETLAA